MSTHKFYSLQPMTETDASNICSWHYPEPYNIYNWPSWENVVQQQIEFGDVRIRTEQYLAIYDEAANLIGFIQLFPLSTTVRLALFLAPHYCNQGLGYSMTRLAIHAAMERYPNYELDLEVETWNKRAIKVYEQAGFRITDEYELPQRNAANPQKHVYCMVHSV